MWRNTVAACPRRDADDHILERYKEPYVDLPEYSHVVKHHCYELGYQVDRQVAKLKAK